ncbi:MAG: hypothetical protein IJV85_00155 [Clostridia bacterium]|nr:hypothetical protein [Clostridia bacterium]
MRKSNFDYSMRRSGWSAFSVIIFLLFFLVIPAVLFLYGENLLQSMLGESAKSICLILAIVTLIATFIATIIKIHIAKKQRYMIKNNTLIICNGHIFFDNVENKKLFYSPGMSVSVDQSLKGWLFNYGDVTISMGLGNAGEIVMKKIKRPEKARKFLTEYLAKLAYADYPYNTNIPNMGNSPYGYGFGIPYGYGYGMPFGYGYSGYPVNCPNQPKN